MPFELGLFYGAQYYGPKKQKGKNAIIFDTKPYRYLEFISDLKGVDILAHQNKPDTISLGYIVAENCGKPDHWQSLRG